MFYEHGFTKDLVQRVTQTIQFVHSIALFCFINYPSTKVQFPNCSRYSKFILVILKRIIVTVQPHCNGHFCWQASLLHLRPKFSVTIRRFTIMGTVRELHYLHINFLGIFLIFKIDPNGSLKRPLL